jgi:hypothetical protein
MVAVATCLPNTLGVLTIILHYTPLGFIVGELLERFLTQSARRRARGTIYNEAKI